MGDRRLENLARRIQKLREDQREVVLTFKDGSAGRFPWLDAAMLIIDDWGNGDNVVDVDGQGVVDVSILRALLRPATERSSK